MSTLIYNVVAKTSALWALGPGEGICFNQTATVVTVAKAYNPSKLEVTAEQIECLKADPHLVVIEGGSAVGGDDVRALQQQLEDAATEKASLLAHIAHISATLDERSKQLDEAQAALLEANNALEAAKAAAKVAAAAPAKAAK